MTPDAPDTRETRHRACNIDARGRSLRLLSGALTLVVAAVIAVAALAGALASPWWWVLVAASALGGALQVYEGWAGWCVLRAMGLRTPI